MVEVTQNNFDEVLEKVKSGDMAFYIPTYTSCTKIDGKCFARFAKTGHTPLFKSMDGEGFRLASGKRTVYILPYQLKAEYL